MILFSLLQPSTMQEGNYLIDELLTLLYNMKKMPR